MTMNPTPTADATTGLSVKNHSVAAHAIRKIEKQRLGKRQNITCVKFRGSENVKT